MNQICSRLKKYPTFEGINSVRLYSYSKLFLKRLWVTNQGVRRDFLMKKIISEISLNSPFKSRRPRRYLPIQSSHCTENVMYLGNIPMAGRNNVVFLVNIDPEYE